MIGGNRDEYEDENGDEDRDAGGNGSVKVDTNGEEAEGEREPGNLISYNRGGANYARVPYE